MSCCACAGSCGHYGPHSYCAQHGGVSPINQPQGQQWPGFPGGYGNYQVPSYIQQLDAKLDRVLELLSKLSAAELVPAKESEK